MMGHDEENGIRSVEHHLLDTTHVNEYIDKELNKFKSSYV
jgi:hypothetical protein